MSLKKLPVTSWRGRRYFVDRRLGDLRNVANPHDRLDLDDWKSGMGSDGLV